MEAFIIWTFIVYGIQIVTFNTDLLSPFKRWVTSFSFNKDLTPKLDKNGAIKKPPLPLHLTEKMLNCWICVAFWSGFDLTEAGLSTFSNPLLAGLAAVSAIAIYRNLFGTGR